MLPSGWARFPLGRQRVEELEAAIEDVISRALPEDLPWDSAEPYRRMLRKELGNSITQAQDADANAIYLPVAKAAGMIVPASIVEAEFTSPAGEDPFDPLTSLLLEVEADQKVVEVDGRPGIRSVTTLLNLNDPESVSSSQVMYAIKRDDDGHWLAMSFTVVWDSAESAKFAEVLVEFFDAVMTTFRWTGPGMKSLASTNFNTVPGSTNRKGS